MARKTRNELIDAIADAVDALTAPMRIDRTVNGVTEHFVLPNLLDQLDESLMRSGTVSDGSKFGFRSASSPAVDEAIDVLIEIDRTVDHWVTTLGLTARNGASANLRLVLGAATTIVDIETLRDLENEFSRLATIAAVMTEWESRPFAPRASCPLCEARGTLRIREKSKTGACVHCGAHWTPETLGILAEHVRADNAARAMAGTVVVQ